jgi:hypothetical protein
MARVMDRWPDRSIGRPGPSVTGLVVILAAFWLWMPLLVLIWWGFISVVMPGVGPVHLGLRLWWDSWFGVGSGWRWVFFGVGGLGTAVISWARAAAMRDGPARAVAVSVGIAGLALAVASLVLFIRAVWDNDKDLARFYGSRTTFIVPDPGNPPTTLARLFRDNRPGDGRRCDLGGPRESDVPACIRRGTLPPAGFEPRVGSRDGALAVMGRSSGTVANVRLLDETLAYLNAGSGRPAAWSAIRDGGGIDTPMYGVVEWTGGSERPTQCRFSGRYRIDRAFGGGRRNSLPNLLNDRFPRLIFDRNDAWGYCRGDEPVVVIPVQRQIHYKDRTVRVAAGVVIVRGSPAGRTRFEHRTDVRPGELPGPVYPESLVNAQRAAVQWAGGREIHDRQKFGFEPTDSKVQQGNVKDYLLRRADDGRLYRVTPATPRQSDSQQFVAYEMVPADTVSDGQLNPLDIYVLADDDPRVINIDQLAAAATDYIAGANPGLISSGASLVEFLPVQGDIWQAYVEINGRVVYRLTISYENKIPTRLVSVDTGTAAGEGGGGGRPAAGGTPGPANPSARTDCTRPPAELTDRQLTDCIRAWADELARRSLSTAPPSP